MSGRSYLFEVVWSTLIALAALVSVALPTSGTVPTPTPRPTAIPIPATIHAVETAQAVPTETAPPPPTATVSPDPPTSTPLPTATHTAQATISASATRCDPDNIFCGEDGRLESTPTPIVRITYAPYGHLPYYSCIPPEQGCTKLGDVIGDGGVKIPALPVFCVDDKFGAIWAALNAECTQWVVIYGGGICWGRLVGYEKPYCEG